MTTHTYLRNSTMRGGKESESMVRSLIITNVPSWWEMFIMGRLCMCGGQGKCGKSLYFPLNFAVKPKLLNKNKVFEIKLKELNLYLVIHVNI